VFVGVQVDDDKLSSVLDEADQSQTFRLHCCRSKSTCVSSSPSHPRLT
jgi:hypothetical protein